MRGLLVTGISLMALAGASHADAADLSGALPTKAPPPAAAYDWIGFYVGGHVGYAGGSSHWATSNASGSFSLYQGFDAFKDTGSYFEGLQLGYNSLLPNRIVIGAEIDAAMNSNKSAQTRRAPRSQK